MIKILMKKILCCLLCLSLFFSLLIVPSHKVYAGGLKNITDTLLRISDNADGNFTWSGMHYLLWSDDETYSEVRTFLRKGINTAASMYGAAMSNNWAVFCSSFADFLLSHDADDATVLTVDGDDVYLTDDFMKYLKLYFDSQKDDDSSTGYKSTSGLLQINYQVVKTSSYEQAYDMYINPELYDFVFDIKDFHGSGTTTYAEWKKYFLENLSYRKWDLSQGGTIENNTWPAVAIFYPSEKNKLKAYFQRYYDAGSSQVYGSGSIGDYYCPSMSYNMRWNLTLQDTRWTPFLCGQVNSDGTWKVGFKYVDWGNNESTGFFGYTNYVTTYNILDTSQGVISATSAQTCGDFYTQPMNVYYGCGDEGVDWKNVLSTDVEGNIGFTADGLYIPCLATPDGGYVKIFRTDQDAIRYFKGMGSMSAPDYPYTGGNVYITNNYITYDPPSDDPDNPDSPDTPSGDDDNIWHDPSDDVPDAPFSGTVTEGLETIIKYLKKIYHQLILNNVLTGADLLNDIFNNYIKSAGEAVADVATVAKNKFPFCIPGVIVTAITLTAVDAAPPKFEIPFKYERLGIDYTIEIDFTTDMWDGCRKVIWYFTLFLSIIGFIKLTILMTRSNN